MFPNRAMQPLTQDNPLWISWHDTQTMASLSTLNIMDYFCRKENPFYDKLSNNETIRMQRLSPEHLITMTGIEFSLIHAAEPMLFVIRKLHRHNATETTPISDYYIIGGYVYKAPDMCSIINFRILSSISNLQSAFDEATSFSRYHPSKGYYWDFSSNKSYTDKSKAKKKNEAETEAATVFQKYRTDMLLQEMLRRFPPPVPPALRKQMEQQQQQVPQVDIMDVATTSAAGAAIAASVGGGTTIANETTVATTAQTAADMKAETADMKPPPEKKMKL